MNIAICDDMNAQLDVLEKSITNCRVWGAESPVVDRFTDGNGLLRSVRSGVDYSFIFLDIEMPNTSGLELYNTLAKIDTSVVFVSAHTKYLPESYWLRAPGFLHKGYDQNTFDRMVKTIIGQRSETQLFKYSSDGKTLAVPYSEILMFSVEKRALHVHTISNENHSKTYLYTGSLSSLESQLSVFGFFRCSKTHFVNLLHCSGRLGNSIVFKLADIGEVVVISRRKLPGFDSECVRHRWR